MNRVGQKQGYDESANKMNTTAFTDIGDLTGVMKYYCPYSLVP